MNQDNWIHSFNSRAPELTELSTYRSKLIQRFTNFRDVKIWKMYGKYMENSNYLKKSHLAIFK